MPKPSSDTGLRYESKSVSAQDDLASVLSLKLEQADLVSYERIVLVNPTRYLGNLLIAGNLIQAFAHWCAVREIKLTIVLDAAFESLVQNAFHPNTDLLFYPRQSLNQARPMRKVRIFLDYIRQIRRCNAQLSFNIEEDSVSDRLVQLSGAKFKLGCSLQKNRYFYDYVLPINYASRPLGREHRWHSYAEVFSALGMKAPAIEQYLDNIQESKPDLAKLPSLASKINNSSIKPVLIHAGATKEYKKWPASHFLKVSQKLIESGYLPVLIGAGSVDAKTNERIAEGLSNLGLSEQFIDVCNCLSLGELAWLMRRSTAMVGNDSGPSHLAASLGLPGVVIFGPTELQLWAPLGENNPALQRKALCSLECSRKSCAKSRQCLSGISPEEVLILLLNNI